MMDRNQLVISISLWKVYQLQKHRFICSARFLSVYRYNQKSDIWALGCVLYELSSLKRAFEAAVSFY